MERLKQFRAKKGLSQARLAARAELDPSTVNQIERGAREANPGTLRKLADALEVSLYELMEEEAPKAPSRSSTEPPEESEGERLLTRLIRRLIADLKEDTSRWESAVRTGGVGLAGYKEVVARRISIQNSLGALDDVSKTLGIDMSARRGGPVRSARRDLQSVFDRWNAARTELIERHFNSLTGTQLEERRAHRDEEKEHTKETAKWFDVG